MRSDWAMDSLEPMVLVAPEPLEPQFWAVKAEEVRAKDLEEGKQIQFLESLLQHPVVVDDLEFKYRKVYWLATTAPISIYKNGVVINFSKCVVVGSYTMLRLQLQSRGKFQIIFGDRKAPQRIINLTVTRSSLTTPSNPTVNLLLLVPPGNIYDDVRYMLTKVFQFAHYYGQEGIQGYSLPPKWNAIVLVYANEHSLIPIVEYLKSFAVEVVLFVPNTDKNLQDPELLYYCALAEVIQRQIELVKEDKKLYSASVPVSNFEDIISFMMHTWFTRTHDVFSNSTIEACFFQ
jgi:hypothetical protein